MRKSANKHAWINRENLSQEKRGPAEGTKIKNDSLEKHLHTRNAGLNSYLVMQ
jgi:hypothetical protein